MDTPNTYPTDLSENERELGFQLLRVEALGLSYEQSLPAVAVVYRVSTSRILLKTESGYELKIFGKCAIPSKRGNPMWNAASTSHGREIRNAELFIHECKIGTHDAGLCSVKEHPYKWELA